MDPTRMSIAPGNTTYSIYVYIHTVHTYKQTYIHTYIRTMLVSFHCDSLIFILGADLDDDDDDDEPDDPVVHTYLIYFLKSG